MTELSERRNANFRFCCCLFAFPLVEEVIEVLLLPLFPAVGAVAVTTASVAAAATVVQVGW